MRRASGKRAFERRGGVIVDRGVRADGRKFVFQMPASIVGEALPAAERDVRRAEIGGDDEGRARQAILALHDEKAPEMLEPLLVALAKGRISAPSRLIHYADDPRVQPALVDAVQTVPLSDVPNFAQGLGLIGGPGARDALRARMREAIAHPDAFAPDPFFNQVAGAAMTCAEHLLRLDAEDQEAADTLVRLTGHECAFNKRSAVWRSAQVLECHEGLQTRALRSLRAALTALIDAPEDDVFSVLAPAFWSDPRVPARVSRLLRSRSSAKQLVGVSAASKAREAGWPLVIDWASAPRDPILVLTTLGRNVRLLPAARRAEIVRRGLANAAPATRGDAAHVLASLDKEVAAKLARQALTDEPDPALRAQLAVYAGRTTLSKSSRHRRLSGERR